MSLSICQCLLPFAFKCKTKQIITILYKRLSGHICIRNRVNEKKGMQPITMCSRDCLLDYVICPITRTSSCIQLRADLFYSKNIYTIKNMKYACGQISLQDLSMDWQPQMEHATITWPVTPSQAGVHCGFYVLLVSEQAEAEAFGALLHRAGFTPANNASLNKTHSEVWDADWNSNSVDHDSCTSMKLS